MNGYRTPPPPGNLGGHYWPPMYAAIAIYVGLSSAATHYLAHWIGMPGDWYAPWLWPVWCVRGWASGDPPARAAITVCAYGMVIAAFVLMALARSARAVHRQGLTAGNEDLHGSARWAERSDIEAAGLLGAAQGVYVGAWQDPASNRLHYLRDDSTVHVLAFMPSGSGKGVGLVIPTLLAWAESVVVYDIKGENWARTAGYRASQGHRVYKFSPVEEDGACFNPLAEIRLFTKRDVSDARNIAETLVAPQAAIESDAGVHFRKASASLHTGMILHVCYSALREGRCASLVDLAYMYSKGTFEDTLREAMQYQHDPGMQHQWRTPEGVLTATHPAVLQEFQRMLNRTGREEFSNVLSATAMTVDVFTDRLVADAVGHSDFVINDLVNADEPVSLYIVVPPSDYVRLRGLVRIIITGILNRLMERMDTGGFVDGTVKNKHRLLFMIDEFPSLNKMEIFANALAYMRGYGMKAFIICQDYAQLQAQYGHDQTVVSNCNIRIASAPNNPATAQLLSDMLGKRTVPRAALSYSGDQHANALDHVSATVNLERRDLLAADEVTALVRPPKKDGERIVEPGDMLIFVSGRHPIFGRQLLYFFDPELKRRASLPPPECPRRKPAVHLDDAEIMDLPPEVEAEFQWFEA